MSISNESGGHHTGAWRRAGRLGGREARAWALAVCGVAYWADILRGSFAAEGMTAAAALNEVLANGAFDVFAWSLLVLHCATAERDGPASPWAIAGIVLAGLVALVPARTASGAALALAGVLVFSGRDVPAPARRLRVLLFGLALETVWLSPPMASVHVAVAWMDAQATALLLGLAGQAAAVQGNVLQNLSARFSIEIWSYCASSYPLAGVALAFTTIVLYRGARFRRAYLPWLALSCLASVLLTELRLALLSDGEASYHWWHDGNGTALYALAALGLSVAFPLAATRGGPVAVPGPLAGSAA